MLFLRPLLLIVAILLLGQNQLTAFGTSTCQTSGGATSDILSSATVNAAPATVSGTNFSTSVPVPTGTNVMSVVATPSAAGPTVTQHVQVITSGTAAPALTYDLNGNCTQDEKGYAYTWDALNRLTKVTYPGGATSNFAYDGLNRRVSIIEKNSGGTTTSTKLGIWVGTQLAEERDSTGTTVTKRFFPQGEQQSGTNYYYTKDHLGSVREMCSSTGTITSRMAYDPYGVTTTVSGTVLPTKQYAGYYQHQTSGLQLSWSRAYDPTTGAG